MTQDERPYWLRKGGQLSRLSAVEGAVSKVLLLVAVVFLGFFALVYVFAPMLLGHSTYVASGTATITPEAAAHARVPALICSGRGGPLESSGVYGDLVGSSAQDGALVLCRMPTVEQAIAFEESAYLGGMPRNMHVYLWLEPRDDLQAVCEGATEPIITVPGLLRPSASSDDPPASPCSHPDPEGSLGYAITFRKDDDSTRESIDITVRPRGYP